MASFASAWVRKFVLLTPETTVSEARRHLKPGSYAVIVGADGEPLACLDALSIRGWPGEDALAAQRESWPTPCVLPEAEAIGVGEVARFFRDDLSENLWLPGIILVDAQGRPSAICPRSLFDKALQAMQSPEAVAKGWGGFYGEHEEPAAGLIEPGTEGDLRVKRYGRLQFPAQVPLHTPSPLTITINRELVPGAAGQIELGLTARQWPLQVVASLWGVAPEDFLVVGPAEGTIEVQREGDSRPLTFTLVPQSPGEKTVRVTFYQNGTYHGTAIVATQVVAAATSSGGEAKVSDWPVFASKGQPPDVTVLVERCGHDRQRYKVSVITCSDDGKRLKREIDEIQYEQPPREYFADILEDLNTRTGNGSLPAEFDDEVRRIGSSLYDRLLHADGFHAFYWNEMNKLPPETTVQVVSDDPYFPWEFLRPWRRLDDGSVERSEPEYFCQRFALSRWLVVGPCPGTHLPLLGATVVRPSSSLAYAQPEVEDIIKRFGAKAKPIIDTRAKLLSFLKDGRSEVVHFACHGYFELNNPDRSAIVLGTEHLRPTDLAGEWTGFGLARPLVFVNACESGQAGIGLSGPDGWAHAFLRAGAGFFIGSVWKADDKIACDFAKAFYELLWDGIAVGEAVRRARAKVAKSGDATHLSYTLYANPCIRAARRSTN